METKVMFKNILVCLDGQKPSEAILPLVADLAGYSGGRVVLLNVIFIPHFFTGLGKTEIEPIQSTQPSKQEEDVSDYLECIAESWRAKGLEVECVYVTGTTEESIIAYARTYKADLIALVTHDHSPWNRLILGSTTDYIIRKSGIPVLVLCKDNTKVKNQGESFKEIIA